MSRMLCVHLYDSELFDKRLNNQLESLIEIEIIEHENILKIIKNEYLNYGCPILRIL